MKEQPYRIARVAELLGVTVSTVKRWADDGELACDRTAGGHRRFRPADVETFRRARRSRVEPSAGQELATWLGKDATVRETVLKLLDLRSKASSWIEIADHAGVALDEVGRRWERSELSVLEEHVISARFERAICWLIDSFPWAPQRPHCLLLTPELEDHSLGLLLAELCMREAGWRTTMVGRRTPLSSVVPHLRADSVDCVAASASRYNSDPQILASYYEGLASAAHAAGVAVVVGGSGAWPEAPAYGHRVQSFSELGELLAPPSPLSLQ